jgi:hypothetical protein
MASISTYAAMAEAAYHKEVATHTINGWQCSHWENGTWYGNGLQGGIYQNDKELIVAVKGTQPAKTKFSDVTADIRLGVGIVPNQAGGAYALAKLASEIAKGRPVTIVGHSLGGGLAQVVGVWAEINFVAFNAPGMKDQVKLSTFNFMKPLQMIRSIRSRSTQESPGWCFRVKGDPVSAIGRHIGVEVELAYCGEASGGFLGGLKDHGKMHLMASVVAALKPTEWWNMEAF